MKKLTALLLCFGMMFSVAACSSGSKVDDKALSALETSVQKFSELKSGTYTVAVDLDVAGKKAKMQLNGDVIATKGKPEMSANISMEAEGQKLENYIQLFLKDDTFYTSILGITKQKFPLKELLKDAKLPSTSTKPDTFKMKKEDMKPYLKKASLHGNDVNIVFDTDKMNKIISGNEPVAKTKVKFNTLSMKMTLKDGFMEKAVITMDMASDEANKTQVATGTITLNIKNMNTVKAITFPDLSDYKESNPLK